MTAGTTHHFVTHGPEERFFDGVAFPAAGWQIAEVVPSSPVTHVVPRRTGN